MIRSFALLRSAREMPRPVWLGLLTVALLTAVVALAYGTRYLVRTVWGNCFSRECAYLPSAPAVGFAFILGMYLVLFGVAVYQLLHYAARGQEDGQAPRGPALARTWRFGLTRAEGLALLLILTLAAALRFGRVEISSFKWGEAISAGLGAAILNEGRINLIGVVSSQDVPQLPGYSYLLAPIAALTRDPLALASYGAVMNLMAVYLCFLIGRRWFGTGVGLVSAFLFAVGFWSVHCGSRAWQQCLLPAPSLLFLDAALLVAIAGRPWALVLAAFWTGVMTHLHILSPLYLLVLLLALLFSFRRIALQHLAISAMTFVLLLSPYLLWQLTPNVSFRDIRHVLRSNSGGIAQLDVTPLYFLSELASASGAQQLLAPRDGLFASEAAPWQAISIIGGLLAAAGLCVCVYEIVTRREGWVAYLLLLATLIAPTVLLWRHTIDIYAHYLYGVMPTLALLGGVAYMRIWRLPRTATRTRSSAMRARASGAALLATCLLALHAISSIQVVTTLNRLVLTVANDDYGVPANHTQAAAAELDRTWREAGSSNPIYVGGHRTDLAPLLYSLSAERNPSIQAFDDCKQLPHAAWPGSAVVFLWNANAPAAEKLAAAGRVQSFQRLPRPGGEAFGLYVIDAGALAGQEILALGPDEPPPPACRGRV